MKKLNYNLTILSMIILLSLINPIHSQIREGSVVNTSRIYTFVEEQLNLGPRIPGSEGSEAFDIWLKETVPSPWKITTQAFDYKEVELKNYLISTTEILPQVLIMAHWDTRAVADQDPNLFKRNEPVPGASDSASGVAGILELIQHIPEEDRYKFGFLLVDGEDQGSGGMDGWSWIVGSSHFADSMTEEEIDQTKAVILFDMIGDDDLNLPYERGGDPDLIDEIWGIAAELGYGSIFLDEPGYSLTDDHVPFKRKGIPVLDIIDFDYPEWHTTNDDIDHISSESIGIVVDVILNWMELKMNTSITSPPVTSLNSTSSNTPIVFSVIPLIVIYYSKFKR